MILNPSQAKAVYEAMRALNNVCAIAHVRILQADLSVIHVREYMTDQVQILEGDVHGNALGRVEDYISQAEFAKAYSL